MSKRGLSAGGEREPKLKRKRIKRRCCAKGCNGSDMVLPMFTFPKITWWLNGVLELNETQVSRCRMWLSNIGNAQLLEKEMSKLNGHHFVCASHFEPDQFNCRDGRTLKRNAVPTIFSNQQEVISKVRKEIGHEETRSTSIIQTISASVNNVTPADLFGIGQSERNLTPEYEISLASAQNHDTGKTVRNVGSSTMGFNHVGHGQIKTAFETGNSFSRNQSNNEGQTVNNSSLAVAGNSDDTEQGGNNCETTEHMGNSTVEWSSVVGSERLPKKKVKHKCCAPGCSSTNLTSKMFSFPLIGKEMKDGSVHIDEDLLLRCKLWVRNTGNSTLTLMHPLKLNQDYSLCSLHFNKDQFCPRGDLKTIAVPTIFATPSLSSAKFMQYEQNLKKILGFTSEGHIDEDTILGITSPRSWALTFEIHLRSLEWFVCQNCKEKHMRSSLYNSGCVHGENCVDYSEANDMDPGDVPEELQDLTFIEEQLISRVHPLVSVFKLKGLQLGYSGNVINFSQAVERFADELPPKVTDLSSVLTVRFSSEKVEAREFHVRAVKVYNALVWLKQNNPYYEHINISDENLKALPEDGNVFDELPSVTVTGDQSLSTEENDVTGLYHSSVPITSTPSQDGQINSSLNGPEMSKHPVDEFKTAGYIACAYPSLFPHGIADLGSHRLKLIKPSNYFKHLMNYRDHRFAKHATFPFFALNSTVRWNASTDGNIFVKKNKGFDNVTVQDLKNMRKENPNLMKKVMFQDPNLRGTKAYWHARCNELRDMVEQLSLPTFFLTLSAANLHWPDLYRLLTDRDLDVLTEQERRRLLQENPLIVDRFFDFRVEYFIKHVLQPGYRVIDWWYRVDFQHRGSPHLHGFFWLDGAPNVTNYENETDEKKADILHYFEDLICAVNPDPHCRASDDHPCRKAYEDVCDDEEDLAQLLRTVQRHTKCSTDYCLRLNKKTGREQCRFNFPMELNEQTKFVLSEEQKLEYVPSRNDQWLNKYNPLMLQVWRANMDISPVISKQALIAYLAKYISKHNLSKGYENLFYWLLDSVKEDESSRKFLQKYFIKTCAERDFSAQEVCHILLGNELYSSGERKLTYIDLSMADEWVSVTGGLSDDIENECISQYGKSFLEKYKSRPVSLESVTLWEAGLSYNPLTWKHHKRNNIVRVYPKCHLTDDDDTNEKYYRQMVLLHLPWRNEKSLTGGKSWKDLYTEKEVSAKSTLACKLGDVQYENKT